METDEQKKNAKLEALKYEVKDFHPVLSALLPKLPLVNQCEYTHGATEAGADFVLQRIDETLGEVTYIGVVVKVGKIGPSDTGTIIRQVKECKIPKNFGANKKINITSFWVVTNGKITTSAQNLFENEFKNLSVVFLPQHRIRELIDSHYPEFWVNFNHEIAAKLSEIRGSVQALDMQASLMPIESTDFYVKQKLFTKKVTRKKQMQKKWRSDYAEVQLSSLYIQNKLIIVEADYGHGKSKLLREQVKLLCQPSHFEENQTVPHFINFWSFYNEFDGNIDSFLESRGFSGDLFRNDLRQVIFFDSLDETKLNIDKQISALESMLLSLDAHDDVTIVVASRPVNQSTKKLLIDAKAKFVELAPLSFQQIIKFVNHLTQQITKRTKVIEDLRNSPLYRDLPRSPICAILLAKLVAENAQDIPSSLPELYDKYMDLAIGKWDQKKGLQTEKEYKASLNILYRISKYFVDNDLQSISKGEIQGFFTQYCDERSTGIDPIKLFEECISRSSVLITNPFDDTIAFKHRTYNEFLYARYMRVDNSFDIKGNALDTYWTTINYFYLGVQPDCANDINKLLEVELDPESLNHRWTMALHYPKYMLAASETPQAILYPVFKKCLVEFVRLYIDSRNGETAFPKNRLTKMQFVSLVTTFFKTHYSFDFFKKSLDDACLDIATIFETSEEKSCAAFFLTFARLGFDDPLIAEELVKSDMGDLPVEMQAVIAIESDRKECRSIIVKQYTRKVTKLLSSKEKGFKGIKVHTLADKLQNDVIR